MNGAAPPRPSRLARLAGDPRPLAVALFAYGVARAALLSFTHDEALTYLYHVRAPWSAVFAHTAPLPSNNHLLNTLAVKALLLVLPPTELVLRLPALCGLALFLWAATRLVSAAATGARRPLGLLLLAANPFLFDLLVVCRGYALALGLALASLAAIAAGPPERRSAGAAWLAAAAAGAAVLANLGFAHVFLGLACAAAVAVLLAREPSGGGSPLRAVITALAPFALTGLVLATVYSPPVLARIRQPLAGWGGAQGIWLDTVRSLAEATLYGAAWTQRWHGAPAVALAVLAALVLVAAIVRLALAGRRQAMSGGELRLGAAVLTLVLAWMASATLAHVALGMSYPIERAAAFLVPCLALLLVGLWEATARAGRRPTRAALAAAAAMTLAHFAVCLNLSRTRLWSFDADGRSVMAAVARAAASAPAGSLQLGVTWLLEPAANYYRITRGITGLATVTRQGVRPGSDLYYLLGEDRRSVRELGLSTCVELPTSGTVLAAAPGLPCPQP